MVNLACWLNFQAKLDIEKCMAKITLAAFISTGLVCALSHGTKIDTSDCASLLPAGEC